MYVAIVDLYPLILPNRPRNKLIEIEHFGLYPLYPPLPLSPLYQPPRGLYSGVLWREVENHTINLCLNTIIIYI